MRAAGTDGDRPLFGLEDLLSRARNELRLGHPVRLTGGNAPNSLILAAELVETRWLDALREAGGGSLDLVLSRQRARTLQIRVYDRDLARIPVEKSMTAAFIAALADPSRDLDHPLRGPFPTRRGGSTADATLALQLVRRAGLLAAALVARTGERLPDPLCHASSVPRDALQAVPRPPSIERIATALMPMPGSEEAQVHLFRERESGEEHLAFELGPLYRVEAPAVRVHSSCYTGDVLGSLRCDCGPQLREGIRRAAEGGGVVIVLQQEGRGIGLANKIRAYALQDLGLDTYEANRRLGFEDDERAFGIAAAILGLLGIRRIRLMTSNPEKAAAIRSCGVDVAEVVPHDMGSNPHNSRYLEAKRRRRGNAV